MITLNDKTTWSPSEDQIEQWKAAYPAVNVLAELRKMGAWCDANPQKRKTRGGVARFCNTWLARAQDRGGSSPDGIGKPTLRTQQIDHSLVDISWVPQDQVEAQKQWYLEMRGCYFDGKELRYA